MLPGVSFLALGKNRVIPGQSKCTEESDLPSRGAWGSPPPAAREEGVTRTGLGQPCQALHRLPEASGLGWSGCWRRGGWRQTSCHFWWARDPVGARVPAEYGRAGDWAQAGLGLGASSLPPPSGRPRTSRPHEAGWPNGPTPVDKGRSSELLLGSAEPSVATSFGK